MNRSQAREEAFKLIFSITAQKDTYPEAVEIFKEENASLKKSDKKQFNYIVTAAVSVFEKCTEIDKIICDNLSDDWKIERLSKVSLAVLRLAVYEIVFDSDIPDKVAANEAVEIAKKYDIDEAPGFINGVISSVIKAKG